MQASIVKGNEVLFRDVRVSLIEESLHNIWGGFIYLPPKEDMETGEYELRLDDGREGAISVVSVRGGIVMFRGSGPLS